MDDFYLLYINFKIEKQTLHHSLFILYFCIEDKFKNPIN